MDGLVHYSSYAWGLISGFLYALAAPPEHKRRAALDRWQRQWRSDVRRLIQMHPWQPPSREEMRPLRRAILGRTRGEVAALLGPPPATSAQPLPASKRGKWTAETWYYPLDTTRRRALAINFHNDRAHGIEAVAGPGI